MVRCTASGLRQPVAPPPVVRMVGVYDGAQRFPWHPALAAMARAVAPVGEGLWLGTRECGAPGEQAVLQVAGSAVAERRVWLRAR